jgi:hypothetical protein
MKFPETFISVIITSIYQVKSPAKSSAYSMKEELVLKISILAEDFAGDLTWYIDVIITLINVSGNFISDEIWHRLVQVVTGFGESSELNLAAQK